MYRYIDFAISNSPYWILDDRRPPPDRTPFHSLIISNQLLQLPFFHHPVFIISIGTFLQCFVFVQINPASQAGQDKTIWNRQISIINPPTLIPPSIQSSTSLFNTASRNIEKRIPTTPHQTTTYQITALLDPSCLSFCHPPSSTSLSHTPEKEEKLILDLHTFLPLYTLQVACL
jgi:hypothetical protein